MDINLIQNLRNSIKYFAFFLFTIFLGLHGEDSVQYDSVTRSLETVYVESYNESAVKEKQVDGSFKEILYFLGLLLTLGFLYLALSVTYLKHANRVLSFKTL